MLSLRHYTEDRSAADATGTTPPPAKAAKGKATASEGNKQRIDASMKVAEAVGGAAAGESPAVIAEQPAVEEAAVKAAEIVPAGAAQTATADKSNNDNSSSSPQPEIIADSAEAAPPAASAAAGGGTAVAIVSSETAVEVVASEPGPPNAAASMSAKVKAGGSQFKGVYLDKAGTHKWKSSIRVSQREVHLGKEKEISFRLSSHHTLSSCVS